MDRVVVIDTETTGLSPTEGGHRVIDGVIAGRTFHAFINPEGKKSHSKAFKVHKLTEEFLSKKPTFSEIAKPLLEFISGAKLSFYAKHFDMS